MGHIGYAFALKASDQGNKVIGIYNKSKDIEKIKNLKKKGVKLIKKNLKSKNQISKILRSNFINCCVHTAAVSHEIYAKSDPLKAININSLVVLNFLEVLKKNKSLKFINISTGSVFQDIRSSKTISQNTIPTPNSMYAGTKRMGEIFISSFKKNYNLNCCSLRISWVYGPPIIGKKLQIQRGPIPIILYKLIKKKSKNFIFKSGKNFRASFTYIDDVTENILKLTKLKKFNNSIYHLGTGKNNSLEEILILLKKKFKYIKFKLGKGAKPWSNDSVMRGPIINENIQFLKCKYSLNEGLQKYVDWLNKNA
tara:strand:+ start:1050 stop:1979 length:930 start_codon:yes stop_codon:yes gene_type:complete